MLNTFVVESCEMLGRASVPATPKIDLPVRMFPGVQSDTFVSDTVPPDVCPAGMFTVPDFVPIVADTSPFSGIAPDTDPDAPKPVFPVRRSAAANVAPAVS